MPKELPVEKSMFTVSTKRGERRADLHGLNYNTNKQLTREEKQKRRSKWESNRKARSDKDRAKKIVAKAK